MIEVIFPPDWDWPQIHDYFRNRGHIMFDWWYACNGVTVVCKVS